MKAYLLLLSVSNIIVLSACTQQNTKIKSQRQIGGACDVCEAVYESPVAFEKMENMAWMVLVLSFKC